MTEKDIDSVYKQRNRVVRALAVLSQRLGWSAGWWPDADSSSEWCVVWIDLEDERSQQVGWHVPRESVPETLNRRNPGYDGYTDSQKAARLEQFQRPAVDRL